MPIGLVKGFGSKGWIPYATNEGLPVVDATTTAPNLGSLGGQSAYYKVIDDVVYFSLMAVWGGTGCTNGAGTYVLPLPPVGGYPANNALGNVTYGHVNMGGDAVAVRNMQNAGLAGYNAPGTRIPVGRAGVICPQRYAVTEEGAGGSGARASIAAAATSVSVSHALGVPPVGINVTPATDYRVSGMTGFMTNNVGTTSFEIDAHSSGRTVTDAVTNSTTTVTSATAGFTSADLNKVVYGTSDIRQAKIVTATVTNGSQNVTSISPSLVAGDVGHAFFGPGMGPFSTISSQSGTSAVVGVASTDTVSNGDYIVDQPTTIAAVVSPTQITLSQAATASHTGQTLYIGGRDDGKLAGEQRFFWSINGPVNGPNLTGLFVNATYPWTWGSGSVIEVEGWYALTTSDGWN